MLQPLRTISSMKTRLSSHLVVIFLLLALHLILPAPSYALSVENIPFAGSTTIGGKPLPLRNAALLSYLKVIKAYVAALYLPGRGTELALNGTPLIVIKVGDFAAADQVTADGYLGIVNVADGGTA